MRIGELSKRADLSRDTIRFYERHGLIQSTEGPGAANSYRDYSDDTVMTLEVIRDAQAAGLSIAEITIFISQFMTLDGTAEDSLHFLDTRIAEVEARLHASHRFLAMLQQTKTALHRAPQDGVDEVARATPGSKPKR